MIKKLFFSFLLCVIFTTPVHAVRSLPEGVNPDPIEGEAKGTFPELRGSGTLTFINTGGEARLITVCDASKVENATCIGIDVTGTFSGGPNGTAVFNTGSGEVKLQLEDGKVFKFAAQGITMNFMVTNPSIFDAWVENAGARDSGARVSDLSGQVEIACPPDLDTWDVMKMGRVIYVDCHLKTGEDSTAVISFSDMTTFEMRPESELVIDTPPEKESKMSLLAGNIWANIKHMVKDGTMKIHMSQAVAGIKGTRFSLTETGTESKIEVEEGTVVFQSKANSEEVMVSAGESVKATAVGLSEKTTSIKSSKPENPQEKPDSLEKKVSAENNPSDRIIFLIIGSVVVLIFVTAGVVFLNKRKKVN